MEKRLLRGCIIFIKALVAQLSGLNVIFQSRSSVTNSVGILLFICSISALHPSTVKGSEVSEDGLWLEVIEPTSLSTQSLLKGDSIRKIPEAYRTYQLNQEPLYEVLSSAAIIPAIMTLPMPDGSYARVRVEEAPVLSWELQEKYPEIRTYQGVGIDDPTITVRLDNTPMGFHALVISDYGTIYINPVERPARGFYRSFWKSDMVREPFHCYVDGSLLNDEDTISSSFDALHAGLLRSPNNPSGSMLHTYRLAISATGEYYEFIEGRDCPAGSPDGCGMTATQAQIVTTINRVTGIYEREVSITLNLVAFNIYEDPSTDPFTDSVNGTLLDQNQADLDSNVGSDDYDIGHVFSAVGGGGLAQRGVCQSNKARGGTSLNDPSGDVFDVDYVSHEMGHQFSASHTFNGTFDNCGGGNRVADSAYEPGSGTTIMAYAGICGDQNVQRNSNDYFHTRSFDQITAYRDGDGHCSVESPTGNSIPVVDAGSDYTIPQNTPFTLTATGTDGDSTPLTFDWEQYDLGDAQVTNLPQSHSNGPLFRSHPPTLEAWRTIPRFDDILDDTPNWEILPTVDRSLTFRVTARDNLGGVDWDDMSVTVYGSPFAITYPDTADVLECGASDTLLWSVEAPQIASDISAAFSSDDGGSFPVELLATTLNDGSAGFTVPNSLTSNGRVLLEPIDHIFFDVSGRFSVQDSIPPAITAPSHLNGVECTSPDGASPALGYPVVLDQCDAAPDVVNNAPVIFPLYPPGPTTTVTWTATDGSGNSASATQDVTVVDTTPPSITAPADITAECTSPEGTPVDIGSATSSDTCDEAVNIIHNAPALFPLGSNDITWTATDASGNSASAIQNVTIEDTTPPQFDVLTVTPDILWSANHKLVTIVVDITVSDICDTDLSVRLVSITSNEVDNGLGDGDTENDIQGAEFGTDDREFQLRAERLGGGTGRIYTITYEVVDGSGNTTAESVTVVVPHAQK